MKADDKIGVYPSTEPTGVDVAVEECKDLLLSESSHRSLEGFRDELNLKILAAFHRGESTAFARFRREIQKVASSLIYTRDALKTVKGHNSWIIWLQRVLDEVGRRLGIKHD